MNNKNLEFVCILDRSGSMHGLEDDTIKGFNGMIKRQKRDGHARVTTVLFDDKYEVLHNRTDVEAVAPLTEREYYVRGCTALLDAIGKSIEATDKAIKSTVREYRPSKVIFVITTDGYENSSRKFSYEKIGELIESHKEKGWEFIFLGANMDAVKEAAKMGIEAERAVSFKNDSKGVRLNYEVIGETVAAMRAEPSVRMDGRWKERIEQDVKKRGR
jgi:uncharacterized protein YegL